MPRRSSRSLHIVLAVVALAACERRGGCTTAGCGTLIDAAVVEPPTLLPPSTEDIVASDIGEQLFLKLADVGMSTNTDGDEDFQPLLAQRWEWDGPLTLVFHLDPRAHWQDGQPVTAADVEFTFNAYNDSVVASPFRPKLQRIEKVTTRDSLTAVFRFRERYREMFYDAVYHMRILPAHLLRSVPRDQWRTAPFGRQPVGDGPYRFVRWQAAQSIELVADTNFFLGRPGIRRLIWRFTPSLPVAVQQVIADQADIREQLVTPDFVERAKAAQQLAIYTYRGNVYTFLSFNQRAPGDTSQPHPIFGDRDVRRALTMAVDRASLVKSTLGDLGRVPPGPISALVGIWDPDVRQLPYDTAQAARLLSLHGWRDHDGDGIRDKDGQPLAFHMLVPSSCGSNTRGCCKSNFAPSASAPRSTSWKGVSSRSGRAPETSIRRSCRAAMIRHRGPASRSRGPSRGLAARTSAATTIPSSNASCSWRFPPRPASGRARYGGPPWRRSTRTRPRSSCTRSPTSAPSTSASTTCSSGPIRGLPYSAPGASPPTG